MHIPPSGGPPNISSYYQPPGDPIDQIWNLINNNIESTSATPDQIIQSSYQILSLLSNLSGTTPIGMLPGEGIITASALQIKLGNFLLYSKDPASDIQSYLLPMQPLQ